MLLLSRFLFGIAESNIEHRTYIANYVHDRHWMKYFGRLANVKALGIILGSFCYFLMMKFN